MNLTKREMDLLCIALYTRRTALRNIMQHATSVIASSPKLPTHRVDDAKRLNTAAKEELAELAALEQKLRA